ncbi:glycosyltransferase family 4 protein [Ferroplasma acidiphilum]|uniref:Glycosyltransferase family 4 protein n=1 Tax=Ferroplasma acidiphilum TaxID=74969 RepID=A0A7K4FMA0_9ARCH|nr:glycosyltransferase family 4 protein [Ferroplasma acidiphilum]NOL60143.1 glycosyltransferase family 4 protein [Ferroplasma acidiphilum]
MSINENNKLLKIYKNLFFKPEIRTFKNVDKTTLKEIRDTDVVYLFANEFSVFFSGLNIPIIGSMHTFNLVKLENNNIFRKIYFHFVYSIYFKNINVFNLFKADPALMDKLKKNFKVKKIMVLPPGVDASFFYPDYNVNNKNIKFLFIASLVAEKGLDILLPLIDKMDNNNVEFHIAGGGELADKIKTNKRIIYHGILNDTDLAKLYRECDIFIYPSHADTFSLVTLQALSSGLYVMCSDYLKGNFDDFENKYLEYLPLNLDIWYKRVTEVINNRNIIKHDKSEEYSYVKDNYDWPVISKKFYDYMIEYYNESKGITDES